MEKPSNSPNVQTRTPLKRLGLSRKRKSTGAQPCYPDKIQSCDGVSFIPLEISNCKKVTSLYEENKIDASFAKQKDDNIDKNGDDSISEIHSRIRDKVEMIEVLKKSNGKIIELEDLITTWKIGCKNAYLHMDKLLREKQREDIKPKDWLKSLGIWKVMVHHFQDDPDICLSDESE